eukprot:scaffold69346_cov57-Phaeocystis_antarctica.AAC.2
MRWAWVGSKRRDTIHKTGTVHGTWYMIHGTWYRANSGHSAKTDRHTAHITRTVHATVCGRPRQTHVGGQAV